MIIIVSMNAKLLKINNNNNSYNTMQYTAKSEFVNWSSFLDINIKFSAITYFLSMVLNPFNNIIVPSSSQKFSLKEIVQIREN